MIRFIVLQLRVISYFPNCGIAVILSVLGFRKINGLNKILSVDVKAKDHGYLLKNFGEKGWGIFDLQTMAIQMALPANNGVMIKTETKGSICLYRYSF